MQFLPYEHDRFDLVAGFNSFFFADDMVAALREAGRVAKPRAPVVVQVWGRADRCDLTPMLQAVGRLRPPAPPRANPPLSAPGELERIATEAGLIPETAFSASFTMDYPDEETLARLLLSPGGVVEAIDHSGEEAVREAIVAALAPFRTSSGRYRLENEWRYLIATAP